MAINLIITGLEAVRQGVTAQALPVPVESAPPASRVPLRGLTGGKGFGLTPSEWSRPANDNMPRSRGGAGWLAVAFLAADIIVRQVWPRLKKWHKEQTAIAFPRPQAELIQRGEASQNLRLFFGMRFSESVNFYLGEAGLAKKDKSLSEDEFRHYQYLIQQLFPYLPGATIWSMLVYTYGLPMPARPRMANNDRLNIRASTAPALVEGREVVKKGDRDEEEKKGVSILFRAQSAPADEPEAEAFAEAIADQAFPLLMHGSNFGRITIDVSDADIEKDIANMVVRTLRKRTDVLSNLSDLSILFRANGRDRFAYIFRWKGRGSAQNIPKPAPESAPAAPPEPSLSPSQQRVITIGGIDFMQMTDDKGWRTLSCALPIDEESTVDMALYKLVQIMSTALRTVDPEVNTLIIDFSMLHGHLSHPLAQTWEVFRHMPEDIFPERREVALSVRFSEENPVNYVFFRGRSGLRKTYVDPYGKRWELLEIKKGNVREYDLMVHNVARGDITAGAKDAAMAGVEIHIDDYVIRQVGGEVKEILRDAVEIVGRRKDLEYVIFVVPESAVPRQSRFSTLAEWAAYAFMPRGGQTPEMPKPFEGNVQFGIRGVGDIMNVIIYDMRSKPGKMGLREVRYVRENQGVMENRPPLLHLHRERGDVGAESGAVVKPVRPADIYRSSAKKEGADGSILNRPIGDFFKRKGK